MALSANTVWEVRPGAGSDTNGGGYVSGGTDYSQQNAAQISLADLAVTAGSTTITSASALFTSAMVGNLCYISGTNLTTGRYQITAFTNSSTVTVDRTPCPTTNATGGTCNVGGALATWAELEGANGRVSSNLAWIKAGTYSIGTGITLSNTGNTLPNVSPDLTIGYTTTRGDGGSVTITASAAIVMVTTTVANTRIENIILDGNGTATKCWLINAASAERGTVLTNCKAKNYTARGFDCGGHGLVLVGCEALSAAAGATCGFYVLIGACIACEVHCGHGHGFSAEGNNTGDILTFVDCAVYLNNTDVSKSGFNYPGALCTVVLQNCTIHTNSGDGLTTGGSYGAIVVLDSIFYNNTGYGINDSITLPTALQSINYNAFGANGTAARRGVVAGKNDVTLTGDPCVNIAGANNFGLNSTAGAGAACRSAGYPGVFPGGVVTGYLDIGAVQHQDTGGSTPTLQPYFEVSEVAWG